MPFRILFATDLHLRATRPVSRLDPDFLQTQLDKLSQIAQLSGRADITILGGDIFDRPDVPHSVLIRAIQVLSSFTPYTVIGNHDVYGYQGKSIEASAIGVLLEVGALKKLDHIEPKDGINIHAIHAYDQLDGMYTEIKGNMHIAVVHKMLTDKEIPNAGCIMLEDFSAATNAKLILSGDIHTPHAKIIDNKLFLNPGSMTRMSIADRDRIPSVVLVTINDDHEITYETVQLSITPSAVAFDLKNYSERIESETNAKEFTKTYAEAVFSVKSDSHRIGEALDDFIKRNKSPESVGKMIKEYYIKAEKQMLKGAKE